MDFEELNARGWAQVIAEHPCPAIDGGSGRVVTATIRHQNDDMRTVTLDGGDTLHVTGNHRMYSASAQDWVPVKRLRVGEELRTSDGRKSIASLGYQRGRHQVYNIEVEEEHCYFVGDEQVLTHNACDKKTYVTYTKTNEETGEVYSGRSSGTGDPNDIIANRDKDHHMTEKGFGPAVLDKSATGSAGKDAIRGREQQLIDHHGGAKSQGGSSGNAINGVSATNKKAPRYEKAANNKFGKIGSSRKKR